MSCTARQRFLPELVDRVSTALGAADVLPASDKRSLGARFSKLSVQVGPPGLKVAGEVARAPGAGGAGQDAAAAPIAAIEDLLHDASSQVRARGGAGLAVFIDELHAPSRADTAVLLNALQNLDGRRSENPVAVFGAGLPSTPGELTRAATFGERRRPTIGPPCRPAPSLTTHAPTDRKERRCPVRPTPSRARATGRS